MGGSREEERPVVGWREWVALPGLGVDWIKVKVDTGARSSALHAFDLEAFDRAGSPWVRFGLHPVQRDRGHRIEAEAPVLEWRRVKSSSGHLEERPVIETPLRLLGREYPIEVTLTNRDAMGFRMLLGRQAVRRRFHVDPGGSFYNGRPPASGSRAARGRR